MRNLKRALSLALAAIMLIGMMAVGTSAASVGDFSDGAQIEHTEAANVITGLGIMTGRDDGSFDPDATITRAEMTVVIGRLLQGPSANPENYKGLEIFSDVNGHWAAGWINMAYAGNIVSGVGDDRFAPDTTLNVGEATTMILKALGVSYDEANWPLGVMSKAIEIKLFGDVSATASAPMTRDMVAALTFNGLIYSPSGATTTFVVTKDEEVVYRGTNALEAYVIASATTGTLTTDTVAADSLGAVKFGLSEGTTEDDFGRVTKAWKVDGEVLVDIPGTTAVLTYTSDVDDDDVTADLKGYSVPVGDAEENTTVAIGTAGALNSARATIKVVNGAAAAALGGADQTPAAAIAALTGNGKVVEVYATDKLITKVVVIEYKVGTLDVTVAKNGDVTYKVTGLTNGVDYADSEKTDTVVLNGSVSKDDVVTAVNTTKSGVTTLHIYPTTEVIGTMTSYATTAQTITVSGSVYSLGDSVNATNFAGAQSYLAKADYSYFLDQYGYVVKITEPNGEEVVADEFLYVVEAEGSAPVTGNPITNPDGADYTLKIRAVLSDGTVGVYDVKVTKVTASNKSDEAYSGLGVAEGDYVIGGKIIWDVSENPYEDEASELEGNVYAYSVDSKTGKLELSTPATSGSQAGDLYLKNLNADWNGSSATMALAGSINAVVSKSTVFVVIDEDGAKTSATVYTGELPFGSSKKLTSSNEVVVEYVGATTAAVKVAFVDAETVGTPTAKKAGYAYVDKSTEEVSREGNSTIYSYVGIVADGEITLTNDSALLQSGVYAFNADGEIDGAVVTEQGNPAQIIGNLIYNEDDTEFQDMSDAAIIYVGQDLNEVEGNICVVIDDDGDSVVDYIFVIREFLDPGDAAVTLAGDDTLSENNVTSGTITATYDAGTTDYTAVTYTWASSKTSVATVSGSSTTGTVTFAGNGTADITCTVTLSNGAVVTATKTVTCNGVQDATLSVAAGNATLSSGGTRSTTITKTFDGGENSLTADGYTYESSTPGVATVDASGSVTWVAAGTTTITVTATLSNGAKLSATCTVTCE